MWISEEDRHSSKFSLPGHTNISARALMGLFVSYSTIWIIGRQKSTHVRAKKDSFGSVVYLDIFVFYIVYYMEVILLLSKSDYFNTIGIWKITSHFFTCHFIG